MKRIITLLTTLGTLTMAVAAENPKAIFHTSEGDFTCELYPEKAPKTVANFIGLAKGTKEWTDPNSGQKVTGKPLYSNTKFHRTMSGFMIQGGDPLGNGMGGPGYKFDNEDSDLTFSKPGVLAMANAGRNTNGSQFFVTVAPKDYLNGNYTIFGQCISGQQVVDKIANKPSEPGSGKALQPVTLKSIEIVEAGATTDKATSGPAANAGTSATK
jgi:peptidyl-prolyl cis-trans isomerase A (cyclophilin A)